MLSFYFWKKTATKKFEDNLARLFDEIRDKKVIIYGAGEGFVELNKKYKFNELNVVAISDKKFAEETSFEGMRAIVPEEIKNQEYDVLLITNEYPDQILDSLSSEIDACDGRIRLVFEEVVQSERASVNNLEEYNFEKNLKKLSKKLKGKSIVIYGAGIFFEAMKEFYDLSGLNIIGISDRRFEGENSEKEFLGFKTYAPSDLFDLKPDYVLVATRFYINIIEDLEYKVLKGSKIKIRPLFKKPFKVLWKEIWG